MAYRFKANDAVVTDGLRRIAVHEFASVAQALSNRALPLGRKVHEGRKATKRLRSLIRLTAPGFRDARAEISALRDAAQGLSALRDTGALIETLARIELPVDASIRLRQALDARHEVDATAHKHLLRAFGDAMQEAGARAAGWTLEKDGWRAIGPGLEQSHHRFRKALKAARHVKDEDAVHAFRKRAKDHWHHTLLLRGIFPEVMDGYARAAEGLCDDIGDWRDLGLLDAALRALPAHVVAKPDAAAAFTHIVAARRRALRRALKTAGRLTAETPDAYARRLEIWWNASR